MILLLHYYYCLNVVILFIPPPRLTVPCWLSLPVLVSSRLVSLRTDRPVSTPCLPTLWESNSLLLESTRWTPPSPPTAISVMRRSPRKSAPTSRRSATTLPLLPSSQFLDGMVTTCWSPAQTWASAAFSWVGRVSLGFVITAIVHAFCFVFSLWIIDELVQGMEDWEEGRCCQRCYSSRVPGLHPATQSAFWQASPFASAGCV